MNATIWIDAVGWALLHFLWQGIAAAIALSLALAPVKSPAIRYRFSVVTFFLLPLLPLATAIHLAVGEHGQTLPAATIMQESSSVPLVTTISPTPPMALPLRSHQSHDRIVWVVMLWAAGAISFGIVNFIGWLKVRRMVRVGVAPARDNWLSAVARLSQRIGIRRSVRLLESTIVNTPAVIGHFRPVILLPVSLAAGLSPSQIEMILAHELAHIQRSDFLINLAQAAIETILFYHPAVWWISNQIRREREACCDEIAVKVCGGDSIAYARTLADLEEWRSIPQPAVAATSAPIVASVHRLLGLRDPRCPAPIAAAMAAVLVACIALPLGATRLRAAPATAPAPEATISIHILGADGRPAAGARLAIMQHSKTGEDEPAIETIADSTGVATVPSKSLAETEGNPRFVIAADGSGLTVQPVSPNDPTLTIRLSRSNSITVTFIASDGKPVPGLFVEPQFVDPSQGSGERSGFAMVPPSMKQKLSQRTDANGTITFTAFSPEQRVHLEIPDERFATLEIMTDDITLSQTDATPPKTIHLLSAGIVRGALRYGSTGKPAVGVSVSAQGIDDPGAGGSAITDDHGMFVLDHLRPAKYNIAPDLSKAQLDKDWTAVAYDSLSVAAGEQLERKDLTLVAGVVVRGTAVDATTGAPITGAQIGIYGPAHPESGAWVQSARTDVNGIFTARVPAGKQYIYPMGPVAGYVGPGPQQPTAVEGQTLEVRLEYNPDPNRPVVGQVRHADGAPAVRADVLVDPPDGTGMNNGSNTTTDSAGQFRLSSIPNGTLLRARVGDTGTAKPVKVGPQNRNGLVLILTAGSNHSEWPIQVIGVDGKPILNATPLLPVLKPFRIELA